MKSIFGTLILGMALLMVGCATPNFTSAEMRDRWTAITGDPISDEDIFSVGVVVQKWPILGDIPLIGQFFRGSSGQRQKRELVILVTPRIIDDEQGGSYGYGNYQPSLPAARQLTRSAFDS